MSRRTAALGLAAGLLAACGRAPEPPPASLPAAAVRLVAPRGRAQQTRVPAMIEPRQRATLSTRAPAQVKRVRVRAGDRVRAGEVLASLADGDLRAQLAGARIERSLSRALEQRLSRLLSEGAAARVELDAARARRAEADASVAAAARWR